MGTRKLASAILLTALTTLQQSLGPRCWSQTAQKPKTDTQAGRVAGDAGTAAKTTPKHTWEFGKIGAMRDFLVVYGPANLLAAPAVQEELGLSKAQQQKLAALHESYMQMRLDFLSQIEGGVARWGEVMAREEIRFRMERWHALDQILSKAQKKRLIEIGLQTEGPLAVLWPEIQAELRLTPNQHFALEEVEAQVRSGLRTYTRSIHAAFQGPDLENPMGPGSSEEAGERTDGLTDDLDRFNEAFLSNRERAAERIARILTARQRERFNRMLGEPYDVTDLQRPGGGDWQPEDAARYWARREAEKAEAAKKAAEPGAAGEPARR
jgi:hypothetical protein